MGQRQRNIRFFEFESLAGKPYSDLEDEINRVLKDTDEILHFQEVPATQGLATRKFRFVVRRQEESKL